MKKIFVLAISLVILTGCVGGELYTEDDLHTAYEDGRKEGYSDGFEVGCETGYGDGLKDGKDEGYKFGYEDGYDRGYDDGDLEGYDRGYIDGDSVGYDWGFHDGVYEREQYYRSFKDVELPPPPPSPPPLAMPTRIVEDDASYKGELNNV